MSYRDNRNRSGGSSQNRSGNRGRSSGFGQRRPVELHKATCAKCKQEIKVEVYHCCHSYLTME